MNIIYIYYNHIYIYILYYIPIYIPIYIYLFELGTIDTQCIKRVVLKFLKTTLISNLNLLVILKQSCPKVILCSYSPSMRRTGNCLLYLIPKPNQGDIGAPPISDPRPKRTDPQLYTQGHVIII